MIRVLRAGEGRALVLLHPFPLDAEYWRPQLDAPPAGWQLLAPDLRGFGPQGAGDSPASSIGDYARDVLRLLDDERIDRAVIAGVSMGGYVAVALLRLAAERVRALVLANTRIDPDPPENRVNRQKLLALVAHEGSAGVARDMPKLLGGTTERERPDLKAALRATIEATSPAGIAAAVRAMMTRPDATAAAAAFTGPVLIVSGDEDALTPLPLQLAMHAAMPGSEHRVIHGAGHLASLERPAEFNQILQQFLHNVP